MERRILNKALQGFFSKKISLCKIRQGWGLKKVSMLLGHSDISMTSKVYAHLLDGDLKVRGDVSFDFDNDKVSEDIKEIKGVGKVSQVLGQIITESVAGLPQGALFLSRVMDRLSALNSPIQLQDAASS